ncbi:MAG TPA: hypothetical protein VK216_05630 [Magnetospirillaceae bacterium]|nr:hypothetical protein [Magnetospirillaceae bacterium]
MLAFIAAVTLTFFPYGSFFSNDSGLAPPVDPQVFVKDEAAPAGVGPQSIAHEAGYRPALVQSDPATAPLFSAHGAPLGITLGQWIGATGTLEIVALNANAQSVVVHCEGLSPYGAYSLFTSRSDPQASVFAPLDGSGAGNSFVADAGGSATTTVLVSPPLAPASTIVVVFHSDGETHGLSRGAIGITSHNQLIARVPR